MKEKKKHVGKKRSMRLRHKTSDNIYDAIYAGQRGAGFGDIAVYRGGQQYGGFALGQLLGGLGRTVIAPIVKPILHLFEELWYPKPKLLPKI